MITTTQPEAEVQPASLSLLAAERLGKDYVGEVKEPEELQEETQELEQNEVEEIIEDSEEAISAEPEESDKEVSEEETEDTEDNTISSFSELVESQSWDPEWVKGLELDVKINGESGKAKLEDLINSYQIQEAAEGRLSEAKEKSQALHQEIAQKQEKLNEQFSVVAEILNGEKQSLDSEEAALDSGNLDKIDPADYSAKKLKLQQRRGQLDQKIQKAASKFQENVQANEQQQQEFMRNHLAQEQVELVKAIPAWTNPDVAKKEGAEVFQYLVSIGVPESDAGNILDHRQVVLARKAMLFDKSQSKTDVAKKKVTRIPKVLKPGATRSPERANQEKINQSKNRLQQSGSIEDALAILRAGKNP